MQCNVNKLLGIIREKGFTQDSIALSAGMSRATFSRRLKHSDEFTIREIENIKDALELSRDESIDIFLCPTSLKNETNTLICNDR